MAGSGGDGSGGPDRGRQSDLGAPPDPGEKPDSWSPWPGKRTITEGMRRPPDAATSAPAPAPAGPAEAEAAAPTTPPAVLADLRSQLKTDLA